MTCTIKRLTSKEDGHILANVRRFGRHVLSDNVICFKQLKIQKGLAKWYGHRDRVSSVLVARKASDFNARAKSKPSQGGL